MRRVTEEGQLYSLMSKRTSILSLSNNCSARAFASSVFPTPVDPKKRKEPMGYGLARLSNASPRTQHRFCNQLDRLVLANNSLM
jgi:hypothetical protein